MIANMDEVNGFVLAGGRSSRMGTDKALIEWDGRTLLERALDLVRSVSSTVRIVGRHEKFSPFAGGVQDEFPDHGPLGGIHAALQASTSDLNLMLAVDMPFVEARFLEYLLAKARTRNAAVTLPYAGGAWQPLCAVYRKRFAKLAEPALRAGHNKIDPLFAVCEVERIDDIELMTNGFSVEMFRNLNTPEELNAARKN